MGATMHLLDLIDGVDKILAESAPAGENKKRLTLSLNNNDGPKCARFKCKKILLLQRFNEIFIEPQTKAIRLSALLLFCFKSGLELVTHDVLPNARASFTVRTSEFDIIVINESN